MTVHAKVPADWDGPSAWAWSAPDGTNAFASWPGEAMTENGDWFDITVPGWVNSFIVNANGGTVQTADLSIEPGKEAWILVTDAENAQVFYEEPTEEAVVDEAPVAEETPVEEPAEKSNTGLIVGIVAAVALVGAGVGLAVSKKKKQ